jgi:hypothetical protein
MRCVRGFPALSVLGTGFQSGRETRPLSYNEKQYKARRKRLSLRFFEETL